MVWRVEKIKIQSWNKEPEELILIFLQALRSIASYNRLSCKPTTCSWNWSRIAVHAMNGSLFHNQLNLCNCDAVMTNAFWHNLFSLSKIISNEAMTITTELCWKLKNLASEPANSWVEKVPTVLNKVCKSALHPAKEALPLKPQPARVHERLVEPAITVNGYNSQQ